MQTRQNAQDFLHERAPAVLRAVKAVSSGSKRTARRTAESQPVTNTKQQASACSGSERICAVCSLSRKPAARGTDSISTTTRQATSTDGHGERDSRQVGLTHFHYKVVHSIQARPRAILHLSPLPPVHPSHPSLRGFLIIVSLSMPCCLLAQSTLNAV